MAIAMTQTFNKENAKNIFYGGTVFFMVLFLELAFTSISMLGQAKFDQPNIDTPLGQRVAIGDTLWERNDCIGCHSLFGEGAYFAPELGNVYLRYDQSGAGIKQFIKSRPEAGIPYRRSMPQFNFTDDELDALVEFLKYTSEINTLSWPPNKEG